MDRERGNFNFLNELQRCSIVLQEHVDRESSNEANYYNNELTFSHDV